MVVHGWRLLVWKIFICTRNIIHNAMSFVLRMWQIFNLVRWWYKQHTTKKVLISNWMTKYGTCPRLRCETKVRTDWLILMSPRCSPIWNYNYLYQIQYNTVQRKYDNCFSEWLALRVEFVTRQDNAAKHSNIKHGTVTVTWNFIDKELELLYLSLWRLGQHRILPKLKRFED